jgi:ubiquinone/menaquinone biosynthesis C-methylase UbiE
MRHSGTELINPFKVLEHVGIQPGWHVADLGCGALGHFVFPASQFVGGNGRVYAVDIDKSALKAVERAARFDQIWNIHPIWSDIEVVGATRIPEESLDLTLIVNNFFLSQEKAGLVKEALRLTKPDGLILLIGWNKVQYC